MGKTAKKSSLQRALLLSMEGQKQTKVRNELNIFRQHTLTKESGCKRAQPRIQAILPLGGLVHAEVVVFVHRKGRRIDQTV
jgi:hypothetical protein